ncbi:MAG: DUF1778 domain-containing protein [Jaaginema sp. PMC 1079.18]|nr:DUF1778 domain-containing protein [Jaaginema sp. PMC 1080.18]MEC4851748.1 DUF1778 domain-containing protein [Jaaginema sp. PMC 1079.18]MEC4864595.1 DUF1778 domain-containing protein [Jaaginema sp. PMC 1078.18]
MATPKVARTSQRTESLRIRIKPSQRHLIDTAASLQDKTLSAFVLEAAQKAAEETLLDRVVFPLDEQQWAAFNAALERPPETNEALKSMLKQKTPWS